MQPSQKEIRTGAMQVELKLLEKLQTWAIFKHSGDKSVFPAKWVYKNKTKSDGSLKKTKLASLQKVSSKTMHQFCGNFCSK